MARSEDSLLSPSAFSVTLPASFLVPNTQSFCWESVSVDFLESFLYLLLEYGMSFSIAESQFFHHFGKRGFFE